MTEVDNNELINRGKSLLQDCFREGFAYEQNSGHVWIFEGMPDLNNDKKKTIKAYFDDIRLSNRYLKIDDAMTQPAVGGGFGKLLEI